MDKTLYLIDGHSLIFKMYYAFLRHPMINSKGADTSILFGFVKYILELIEREKPSHLAVAFDPPGGTFRHEMYPDYKGTREDTPQLVIDALEPLCELCHAMHIPVLMVKGFEADDVIGSMAKRAEKEGFKVYMVTPDKDYGQLISQNIIQYKPGKAGGENELVDVAKVCERYNIAAPEQVVEILTICGDSSDNVPGVKGVGEVGAGKLISKYGTVANIYEHIDELTPKQREAFENARDHIRLSHELVTIKTDISLDVRTEDMAVDCTYDPAVADLFEKYEFGSLRRFIGNVQPSVATRRNRLQIKETEPEMLCMQAVSNGFCAVMTEGERGDFFSKIRQVTVAVCAEGSQECLTAVGCVDDFKAILTDPAVTKYGYDLKWQMNILRYNGVELAGRLMDIELMHYLVNPEKSHKIDILAKTYLDVNIEDYMATPEKKRELSLFDEVADEDGPDRSAEVATALLLGKAIWKEMAGMDLCTLYETMEEPLMRVLSKMEMEGVAVDMVQLRKYSAGLAVELNGIQEKVRAMAGEPSLNI